MIDRIRIEPGTKPKLAKRDGGDKLGLEGKEQARARLAVCRGQAREAPAAPVRRGQALACCSSSRGSTPRARTASSGPSSRASTRRAARSRRSRRRRRPSSSTTTSGACTPSLPARGEIGIFNRSHYEDVVAVRMLELAPEKVWKRRPGHIVAWERMLVDEGTTIVKVFLNVSKEEQRRAAPGADRRPREALEVPQERPRRAASASTTTSTPTTT